MELVEPNYNENLYSLGCGIANWLGTKVECQRRIEVSANRLVLLLLDGFGWNIMSQALGEVKEARKIHSVFPSTTSTSLTTLFTARVPGDHGVLGYNTFVKRLGGIVNSLRYTHPSSNIRDSLSNGVPFESAFPKAKGYLSQVEKGTAAVLPQGIENTEFTRVVHGKVEETRTYFNIWDAGNSLTALMGKGYRFIYAYIPDVDTLAHKYGPYDPSTLEAAREIFMKFYYALKKRGDYTALITADHGLIETDKVVEMRGEQELMSLLELPPYGDSRALFLKSRFDMKVFLSQRYNLKVYAGEEIPPLLGGITDREYLPDFVAVPLDKASYIFDYREDGNYRKLKGHHGGLLKEEMEIPLVILNG